MIFSLALKSAILLNCSRSWFLWPSSRASIQVGLVFLLRRRFGSNFTHTLACFFFSELALDFLQSLFFPLLLLRCCRFERWRWNENRWQKCCLHDSTAKQNSQSESGKIFCVGQSTRLLVQGQLRSFDRWHLQAKIVNIRSIFLKWKFWRKYLN